MRFGGALLTTTLALAVIAAGCLQPSATIEPASGGAGGDAQADPEDALFFSMRNGHIQGPDGWVQARFTARSEAELRVVYNFRVEKIAAPSAFHVVTYAENGTTLSTTGGASHRVGVAHVRESAAGQPIHADCCPRRGDDGERTGAGSAHFRLEPGESAVVLVAAVNAEAAYLAVDAMGAGNFSPPEVTRGTGATAVLLPDPASNDTTYARAGPVAAGRYDDRARRVPLPEGGVFLVRVASHGSDGAAVIGLPNGTTIREPLDGRFGWVQGVTDAAGELTLRLEDLEKNAPDPNVVALAVPAPTHANVLMRHMEGPGGDG